MAETQETPKSGRITDEHEIFVMVDGTIFTAVYCPYSSTFEKVLMLPELFQDRILATNRTYFETHGAPHPNIEMPADNILYETYFE